ncbi:phosphate signaling complex protein PhoU [Thermosulfurimonas dismutans]|uniref:Phosphate-specific transport system accessory protein PhoU homolog n=1 Tax=Thermosulfurimonas dismutans TaxID=999894 RepID=A0A179D3P8_9BACT|nr:phosphate signaling complex protein PhoU [Thermosulfurimonas dismutans]OAQ20431.1 Phosphate transport system regulatory protein PhoU [Thermosulfurimonas dismutans]
MSVLLEKNLQDIRNHLLEMCRLVVEMVRSAVTAFEKRDPELAEKVIAQDMRVDALDVAIDRLCLETIALKHPVASDLRFVVSTLDMIRDLERLGDQAVNIAERVPRLLALPHVFTCPVDLSEMARKALRMLEEVINAFVGRDAQKAREIKSWDDEVDRYKKLVIEKIVDCMEKNPQTTRIGVEYIVVAQNLERVADLATNIAEEIVYIVEGKVVKHEKVLPEKTEEKEKPYLFDLLERHARLVIECTERLPLALEAYFKGDKERLEEISRDIIDIEREADRLKQNIRGHLPYGIITPVDKFELFLYLKEQDAVADAAEDILKWLTFKQVAVPEVLSSKILKLLEENVKTAEFLGPLIEKSRLYIERGDEASRQDAKEIVREIRRREHENDLFSTEIKREVFALDTDFSRVYFLLQLLEYIGEISGRSENAADLMRAMIAKA